MCTHPYFRGWQIQRQFRQVIDGLSKTLMAGEKFVHTNPVFYGDASLGDGSFFNDDSNFTGVRMAGLGFSILRGLPPPNGAQTEKIQNCFGSAHANGICQFALADGSARGINPDTAQSVLAGWSHISDGVAVIDTD